MIEREEVNRKKMHREGEVGEVEVEEEEPLSLSVSLDGSENVFGTIQERLQQAISIHTYIPVPTYANFKYNTLLSSGTSYLRILPYTESKTSTKKT